MEEPRELAVLTDEGHLVRDPGWRCVADVMMCYHGFVESGGRVYGVIVDAETLLQVHPPPQLNDGLGGPATNVPLG